MCFFITTTLTFQHRSICICLNNACKSIGFVILLIMSSTNNAPEESEADTSAGQPGSSTAVASSSSSTSTVCTPATGRTRSAVWDYFTNLPIEDEDAKKKLFTHQCRHFDKRLKLPYKPGKGGGFYVTSKALDHLMTSHKDIEYNAVKNQMI